MKILALHGLGSDASMLKNQLAPFTKALGPSFRFTFLNGEVLCSKGPGVPSWASGPFFSYTTGFTAAEMRHALNRLDEFVRERGPFQGVFGFSLGASVAIAYMIDQERRSHATPFDFAVLFSPIFVASPDASYCERLLKRLLDQDHTPFRHAFPQGDWMPLLTSAWGSSDGGGDGDDASAAQTFVSYLQNVLAMRSLGIGDIMPNTKTDFLEEENPERIPRLLHPFLVSDRIQIPTVHIAGLGDLPCMREQALVAQDLCSPSTVRSQNHAGGHEVPFKKSEVQTIVSSIRWAIEEAYI
ncbi:putative Serine hydrolase FSH domain-containing protein [Seiridium cardinale]